MRGLVPRLRRLESVFGPSVERSEPLSLRRFCQEAWPIIDSSSLQWSWHLDELCDALEDAARRRYRDESVSLAVAAPPGATKSRPVSVLFHPWVWSWWPGSAWITTSWDEPLAHKFSVLSKDLVTSPWYQERWPMRVRGGSSRWSNDRGGIRFSYGVRSRVTGDHAHFILGDDLLKEQLVRGASPAQIADAVATASDFWYGTLGTRAIDHIGCRVATGQLLHIKDPVTVAIRDRGYERIVFPVTFRSSHPWRSERDRREVDGEVLCERIDKEKIDGIVRDIGPTAAEAQLWQNPQPPGGQILKASYFTKRWERLPGELLRALETTRHGVGQRWLIAGDLSFKSTRQSRRKGGPDWVVYQLWCAVGPLRYLVDQVRGQWGYREAKLRLALFSLRHRIAQTTILEDAANAAALEDDLAAGIDTDELIGAIERHLLSVYDLDDEAQVAWDHYLETGDDSWLRLEVEPQRATTTGRHLDLEPPRGWNPLIELEPHGGGTMARVRSVEGTWHAGHVVLPPHGTPWVDGPRGFVIEHMNYSGVEGETDDQVSCSSLALLRFKGEQAGSYLEQYRSID